MTDEREELVERVARSLCDHPKRDERKIDPFYWRDYEDAARAAIAECEKNRMKLEAEAAAIRGSLIECIHHLTVCLEAQGTGKEHTKIILREYQAALSPEAGERVLDVVRALRLIVEFCDDPQGGEKPESLACGLARLLPTARKALAALGMSHDGGQ